MLFKPTQPQRRIDWIVLYRRKVHYPQIWELESIKDRQGIPYLFQILVFHDILGQANIDAVNDSHEPQGGSLIASCNYKIDLVLLLLPQFPIHTVFYLLQG